MADNVPWSLVDPHPNAGALPHDLLESVAVGYQVLGPDYRYVYLNRSAEVHARAPRETLIGRTMLEAFPGVEQTAMFEVLQRCMTQRVTEQLDNEFTFPDGSKCWFEVRFIPIPQGLLVCSEDITVRRRNEGELRRSRRVLGVISETNQALVRASDEAGFMREVCQIAVDRGGYRLAWIGMKEHDVGRSVRPVARAGLDEGYTDAVQISWDESSARGRGPTGRSVRDGEVVVASVLHTEPTFDPWRAAATARGYASSISLPFSIDGEIAGALVIYSSEPDAFDDHETRLLKELALDLGHGVQGLRARLASQRSAAQVVRLNERLRRLAEVVQSLSGLRDLEAMVELVCRAARDLVGADASTFVLLEGDECVFVGEDAPTPYRKGRRVPMSNCVSGWVMRERRTAAIPDVSVDRRAAGGGAQPPFVRGAAVVPIHGEAPVGAIGVYWSQPYEATDDELGLLETLADSVAIGMERLRVLSELTESEDRYRTLVESLDDVVFALNTSGDVLYLSPSVSRYGYAPVELVGQPFACVIHQDDLDRVWETFTQTVDGAIEPITFRARGKDGREHIVRSAGRVVMRDGQPVGVSGVIVDLTQLRNTEEQLRVAQKMEAVGQLAGGVAHDFNNLLSVILSYADFVGEAVCDRPEVKADMEEIVQAAVRATGLTRQLLAFSRRQVLQPQIVDLNALATGVEKMLGRLVGEHITLIERLDPALGKVRADPGQMEQVIMNLVVNARDAMPEGGTITVETANVQFEQDYTGEHGTLRAGSFVALIVSDTGTGMDEATKLRLFEPFFTTKEVGKGTGLGLSTVHGIVAQSGGSIWFTSTLGVGTTFKLYFPRVSDQDAAPRTLTPDAAREVAHETVLLVEDDRAVRAICERALRAAGYRVLTAEDGQDALRVWDSEHAAIDLLLTDVIMPRMNGSQLAHRLLAHKPTLRVVFMSGYTDNILANHGVLGPGTTLIAKPFNTGELLRRLRAALDATVDA